MRLRTAMSRTVSKTPLHYKKYVDVTRHKIHTQLIWSVDFWCFVFRVAFKPDISDQKGVCMFDELHYLFDNQGSRHGRTIGRDSAYWRIYDCDEFACPCIVVMGRNEDQMIWLGTDSQINKATPLLVLTGVLPNIIGCQNDKWDNIGAVRTVSFI